MAISPGFMTSLILALAKVGARFQTALVNRRAANELLDWDARALKDIGLTRSDLRGALASPLFKDPTEFLSLIAAGREVGARQDGAVRSRNDGRKPAVPAAESKGRHGNLPSAEPALCA